MDELFWVFAEATNGMTSSWMKHDTIEDAREDGRAMLELHFTVAYIYPGDDDAADVTVDPLEKIEERND